MTTLTTGQSYFPDSLGARAGVQTPSLGLTALNLPTFGALPVGEVYFPDGFPRRDSRVAVTSHTWPDWQALINLTTLPAGKAYAPERFPGADERVAVHAQPWVLGSAVINQSAPTGPPPRILPQYPDRFFPIDRQVSIRSQSAQQLTPPSVGAYATATMMGVGTLTGIAMPRQTSSVDGAWSIMLYGATVEGCEYDPIARTLKIWFTGLIGQSIVLQNLGINVTTAIQFAPDPEAYVLALLGAS